MANLAPDAVWEVTTDINGDAIAVNVPTTPLIVANIDSPFIIYQENTVGARGNQGDTGPQGVQGITGLTGPRGSQFKGTYALSSSLPAIDGATVLPYDFAYVGSTSELWVAGVSTWADSGVSLAATIAYSSLTGKPTLGTAAAKDIPVSGDASSSQVVYGTDTRLTNARTPTAHATSHKSGQSDAIKLDELAAPTDITTLDASTAAHGLMPKIPDVAGYEVSSVSGLWVPKSFVCPDTDGIRPGPYNRYQVEDHFNYPVPSTTTNTLITVAPLPWYAMLSGTSAAVVAVGLPGSFGYDAHNKAHGVWQVYTGTSTGGYASVYSEFGSVGSYCGLTPGLGALDLYFRVAFQSVPTAAQNTVFRMGLTYAASWSSVAMIDLIMTYYATNSAAQWVGECYNNTSQSLTSYTGTPTISALSNASLTYYKCKISINAAWTSVTFSVNGIQIGSPITTNIPTAYFGANGAVPFVSAIKLAGTTGNSVFVDHFFLDYQYSV